MVNRVYTFMHACNNATIHAQRTALSKLSLDLQIYNAYWYLEANSTGKTYILPQVKHVTDM